MNQHRYQSLASSSLLGGLIAPGEFTGGLLCSRKHSEENQVALPSQHALHVAKPDHLRSLVTHGEIPQEPW